LSTSSSIRTKLWWNSHWMVLFHNCVQQSRSPTKMATTVKLRCYWKQLWSRWAITCSWEPLVFKLGYLPFLFCAIALQSIKLGYLPFLFCTIALQSIKLFTSHLYFVWLHCNKLNWSYLPFILCVIALQSIKLELPIKLGYLPFIFCVIALQSINF
jgi:hypothetical protein